MHDADALHCLLDDDFDLIYGAHGRPFRDHARQVPAGLLDTMRRIVVGNAQQAQPAHQAQEAPRAPQTGQAGQVAIVTGGGTGIGRACALAFARRGVRVAVNYSRSRDEAEQTAAECGAAGGEGVAIQADVAQRAAVEGLVAQTIQRWERVDYLVNSAGTTVFAALDDLDALTEDVWDRILAVNVKAVFHACRAVAPHMKRQGQGGGPGGAIVNVGSISAIKPVGSSIPYMASKAAVHSLTQTLALALAPEVRVNAVAPGFIETRWHAGGQINAEAARQRTPLHRNGSPEDVAAAVLFLATASFVTGEITVVDGGRFLR